MNPGGLSTLSINYQSLTGGGMMHCVSHLNALGTSKAFMKSSQTIFDTTLMVIF